MLIRFPGTLALFLAVAAASPTSSTEDVARSSRAARYALEIGGGRIELVLSAGETRASPQEIRAWVLRAAEAVTAYFGRFPVQELTISVHRGGSGGVSHGVTYGGRWIRVELGEETTEGDLRDDWVMTHEILHTAFPELDDDHHWMEEGLSTYLEPIARARVGQLAPERVWGDMARGFPNSVPEAGERGFSHTHTWGNTYWGGCRFWLMADLEIRQETEGRKSLDDALKAILDAGGSGGSEWQARRVLDVGDAATGTHVLKRLDAEMGERATPVDLDALWTRLGVELVHGQVKLHDDAPWAAVRHAITARPRPETKL